MKILPPFKTSLNIYPGHWLWLSVTLSSSSQERESTLPCAHPSIKVPTNLRLLLQWNHTIFTDMHFEPDSRRQGKLQDSRLASYAILKLKCLDITSLIWLYHLCKDKKGILWWPSSSQLFSKHVHSRLKTPKRLVRGMADLQNVIVIIADFLVLKANIC